MNRLWQRQIRHSRSGSLAPLLMMAAGCFLIGGCPAEDGDSGKPAPYVLQGTWNRSDGLETLVIAADGRVLQDNLTLTSGFVNIQGEIPCDGERHVVLGSIGQNEADLEMAVDPFKMTVDVAGNISIEEHTVRIYQEGAAAPMIEFQISGNGRFTSPDSITVTTNKEPQGLEQQWIYDRAE